MRLRSLFRSRWVKIPLVLVTLLVIAAIGYFAYRLGTTTPSMYSTIGVVQVKEIYLMDKDGGQLRRISNSEGNDTMPAISPDGKRVVYVTDRARKGMKLWIQSLTDPNDKGHLLEPERANLTGLDMHPRFSPDGKWVVFTSDRGGWMDEWFLSGRFPQPYGELYVLSVDGSSPAIRLTEDKWEDSLAFWGNRRELVANPK